MVLTKYDILVGERPLNGCCRRDEIEECHLEYECNYTNHISFKCLSRGLGGSPSPIHHPANRVESSAIVDVARISKYTYQMVVEPPNRDLNGVTAVTVRYTFQIENTAASHIF